MDMLRRLREASAEKLETYRKNAFLFTLKQQLGPYLKKDLTPEQIHVSGLSISVRDLQFSEESVSAHLVGTGVYVRDLKVARVEIELSTVKCRVDGICISIGLDGSRSKPGPHHNSGKTGHAPESSSVDCYKVLSACIDELLGLLNDYLEVSIHGLTLSLVLSGAPPIGLEPEYPSLTLRIPQFSLRNGFSDLLNQEGARPSLAMSEQNKELTMSSFCVLICDTPFISSGAVAIGLRVANEPSQVPTKLDAKFGAFRVHLLSSRFDELSRVGAALQRLVDPVSSVDLAAAVDSQGSLATSTSSWSAQDRSDQSLFFDCGTEDDAEIQKKAQVPPSVFEVNVDCASDLIVMLEDGTGVETSSTLVKLQIRDANFHFSSVTDGTSSGVVHLSARGLEVSARTGEHPEACLLGVFPEQLGGHQRPIEARFLLPAAAQMQLRLRVKVQRVEALADLASPAAVAVLGLVETLQLAITQEDAPDQQVTPVALDFTSSFILVSVPLMDAGNREPLQKMTHHSCHPPSRSLSTLPSLVFQLQGLETLVSSQGLVSLKVPLLTAELLLGSSTYRVLVAEGMALTSDAPMEMRDMAQGVRHDPLDGVRAWEPRAAQEEEGGARLHSEANHDLGSSPKLAMGVSLDRMAFNIDQTDVTVLSRLKETIGEWANPAVSTPPAPPSEPMQVFIRCSKGCVEVLGHPSVRLDLDELTVCIGSTESTLRLGDLKLTVRPSAGSQVRLVDRAPRVRSKPSFSDQDMVVVTVRQNRVKIDCHSMMVRLELHSLAWVDTLAGLGAASPGGGQGSDASAPTQTTSLIVCAEELLLDLPGPTATCRTQALFDLTRINFSTVLMTPVPPPLVSFNLSADHVRFFFAADSGPYSGATEANFVELLSFAGEEKMLSVRVTQNSQDQSVGLKVELPSSKVSLCADSMLSLQLHVSTLGGSSPKTSHLPSREAPPASGLNSASGAPPSSQWSESLGSDPEEASPDSMDTHLTSLGQAFGGESLCLLPCIEDYFLESQAETPDPAPDLAPDPAPDPEDAHGSLPVAKRVPSDDWVVDGFGDPGVGDGAAVELEEWTMGCNPAAAADPQADSHSDSHREEFPGTQAAGWYDEAPGTSSRVVVNQHYVPLAERQSPLASKMAGSIALDVEVNLGAFRLRLFDGSDFARTPCCDQVPRSRPEAAAREHLVDDNYFDRPASWQGSSRQESRPDSGRRTERLIQATLLKLQARFTSNTEGLWHLMVTSDLAVSQCLGAEVQNVLYAWTTRQQAREELDPTGRPLRLITLDLSATQPDKSWEVDLSLRPLRVSLTWDTVDFIRGFASSLSSEEVAHEEPPPPVGESPDSQATGPVLRVGTIRAVLVSLDFDTRLVDLRAIQAGDVLELLKLFPLSGVELSLCPVCAQDTSLDAFINMALHSWAQEITTSQLHKFAARVGPMRPLAAVGQTAANVILLPLRAYRQNGRVLFGLRQGALEFLKTVTVESAHVSAMVSKSLASTLSFLAETPSRGVAIEQPSGVTSGLSHAQSSLTHGLNIATHAVIAVPLDDYRRGGTGTALKSVVRAVPVAVLASMIGATEAMSFTLLGIRNSMAPDRRHDDVSKFRRAEGD
eukprot:CAMPEP_0172644746 /NCGR_PEP_ID=MMETSP1068-20121228/239371_1 /TAXON_ID=35684 /ORGANISM="Pseudopedinella elastica, Strain CCMP716" /LENGTH=1597 /DNA_ID=CAMNT_0013458957 /DNA_START=28 /DNA_END=4821 /DNA_ORIENTATION=-